MARRIHIPGLSIAGKTGTAQVVALSDDDAKKKDEEIPYRFRDHAWFAAFAPAEAPTIVVSVIVEHGEHGSTAAAPIAKEIIAIHCRDMIGNE